MYFDRQFLLNFSLFSPILTWYLDPDIGIMKIVPHWWPMILGGPFSSSPFFPWPVSAFRWIFWLLLQSLVQLRRSPTGSGSPFANLLSHTSINVKLLFTRSHMLIFAAPNNTSCRCFPGMWRHVQPHFPSPSGSQRPFSFGSLRLSGLIFCTFLVRSFCSCLSQQWLPLSRLCPTCTGPVFILDALAPSISQMYWPLCFS